MGIADVDENSSATLARDVTTSGALTLVSTSNVSSTIQSNPSAKGNSQSGRSADAEANRQRNTTPNRGSDGTLPSISGLLLSGNSSAQSNSSTGSSGVGVAAALALNIHDVTNRAAVENGADVNAAGAITISAIGQSDVNTKAVGTAVVISNTNNIAAGVGLTFATLQNRATVSTGSALRGAAVTLEATTPAGQTNDYVTWGAAAGGGRADLGIAGSVAITFVNAFNTVEAAAGSHIKSTGNLTFSAENRLNPQTMAAGAGFSTSAAFGAAVAITRLNLTTTAFVLGNADAAGALNITATTTVSPTMIDLPFPPPPQNPPVSNPTATSIAVAGSASSGSVGIAGAAGISDLTLVTQAAIGTNAQINRALDITAQPSQSVNVQAADITTLIGLAGSLGVSIGSVGVGAGLDLTLLNKNTRAYVSAGSNVAAAAGMAISATNTDDLDSIAANAGLGGSTGIAGSATVYVLDTGARAYIDSSPTASTTIQSGGSTKVTATGNLSMNTVGASVGFGIKAGFGAGNVTLVHTDNVQAWIGNNSQISVTGGDGLTVKADSSESLIGVSASAAGAGSLAIAGSATALVLDETTTAFIGPQGNIIASNGSAPGAPSINVTARDKSKVVSVAGSLSGAANSAVGLGADVTKLDKRTLAYVDSGSTITAEGNFIVTSDSTEDFTSVAAGAAGAGTAAIAADAAVHVLDITTRSWIGDDPSDNVASKGAGNYLAMGSMLVAADNKTEIDKVTGVAAGATFAGLSGAAGVSTSKKLTEAFIGMVRSSTPWPNSQCPVYTRANSIMEQQDRQSAHLVLNRVQSALLPMLKI